jgi:hypothetical protein
MSGAVPPLLHALAMLCALASAVFATSFGIAPRGLARVSGAAAAAGLFALTAWALSSRTVDALWLGGLVALTAAWHLADPHRVFASLAVAGCLAAAWAAVLSAIGAPRMIAFPGAALVPVVSASLSSRRPSFAPPLLREEALLILLLFAVIVSMGPTVLRGWQSALALNVTDERGGVAMVPAWTVAFVLLSVITGGFWSLWRRG